MKETDTVSYFAGKSATEKKKFCNSGNLSFPFEQRQKKKLFTKIKIGITNTGKTSFFLTY